MENLQSMETAGYRYSSSADPIMITPQFSLAFRPEDKNRGEPAVCEVPELDAFNDDDAPLEHFCRDIKSACHGATLILRTSAIGL